MSLSVAEITALCTGNDSECLTWPSLPGSFTAASSPQLLQLISLAPGSMSSHLLGAAMLLDLASNWLFSELHNYLETLLTIEGLPPILYSLTWWGLSEFSRNVFSSLSM